MSEAIPTVQYETSAARATRWELPPGSATGMHVHEYDYVVVPMTDGTLTITDPDGGETEASLVSGGTYGRTAGTKHDVANRTDQAVVFIEVELLERGLSGDTNS